MYLFHLLLSAIPICLFRLLDFAFGLRKLQGCRGCYTVVSPHSIFFLVPWSVIRSFGLVTVSGPKHAISHGEVDDSLGYKVPRDL